MSQQHESRWSAIETAPGEYDSSALASLDSIITLDREQGASVTMGVYATPRFYADNVTANPYYPDYVTKGPWGLYGECAHPTNLTALENFTAMLVQRYNLPGGAWYDAHSATLGKGIQYWETWNEPPVNGSATNRNTAGDGFESSSFYWGSKNQLVDLCYTQYSVIKSLDASVTVCSPGFAATPAEIVDWLNTAGSAYASVKGADTCDAIAWHQYGYMAKYNRYGEWTRDILDDLSGVRTLRNTLIQSGYNFPLWLTEWGVDGSGDSPTLDEWAVASSSLRYTKIMRCFLTLAAYGVKCVHPWNWESSCCFGDLKNDTYGVQMAYNDFADRVVGKTIQKIRHYRTGEISVQFSTGDWLTV